MSCRCIKPVCDALKRCGSSKRLSFLRSSRIKEAISVTPPRNSAYTVTRCVEPSEIWRLTSGRHEERGGDDHHDRSFQCHRQCGDWQLKLFAISVTDLAQRSSTSVITIDRKSFCRQGCAFRNIYRTIFAFRIVQAWQFSEKWLGWQPCAPTTWISADAHPQSGLPSFVIL